MSSDNKRALDDGGDQDQNAAPAKKPKSTYDTKTPTKVPGFCDICLSLDMSKRFGILQTCQVCGVQVHNRCYGRSVPKANDNAVFRDWHHPALQRDPQWKCLACAAIGTTVETRERDPASGDRIAVKITQRPTECCLCSVSEGMHAMHPMYDCHGRFGRQIVLPGTQNKLAWAHTLCALSVCRHVGGAVYGCEKNGFYDVKDTGEAFAQYDNEPNPDLDRNFEGDAEMGFIHHFVWWGYLQQQLGLKLDQYVKSRLHFQKELKCSLCGKHDDETTTDIQGRPVPATLRIAVQCCANNNDEPKEFKQCHRTSLAKHDTCYQALHVGCAMWGRNEVGEQSLARRAWYYPGTYEVKTPNAFLYCDLHARDLLGNFKKCSNMQERSTGPFTAPPKSKGKLNHNKNENNSKKHPLNQAGRASSHPVAMGRTRFTNHLVQHPPRKAPPAPPPHNHASISPASAMPTAAAQQRTDGATTTATNGMLDQQADSEWSQGVQFQQKKRGRHKNEPKKKKKKSDKTDGKTEGHDPGHDPGADAQDASKINDEIDKLLLQEGSATPAQLDDSNGVPMNAGDGLTEPPPGNDSSATHNQNENVVPDAVASEVVPPARRRQRPSIGSKVRKSFGANGWFDGEVVKQGKKYSQVRYTDGDEEEMSDHELEPAMAAYQEHYRNVNQSSETGTRLEVADPTATGRTSTLAERLAEVKREVCQGLEKPPRRGGNLNDDNQESAASDGAGGNNVVTNHASMAPPLPETVTPNTVAAAADSQFVLTRDPRATLAPLFEEMCSVLEASRSVEGHNERVAQCKGSLLQMIRDMKREVDG